MMTLARRGRRKRFTIFLVSAVTITLIMVCTYQPLHAAAKENRSLKKACIRATIYAIGQEIDLFEQRLKAVKSRSDDVDGNGAGSDSNSDTADNSAKVSEYKQRIKELKAERRKYWFMKVSKYTLPQSKSVTVAVTQLYHPGSILELVNITRSGPFYHLAGIKDHDYQALKAGSIYTMTIYLVYQRDYALPHIENYYVYVSAFSAIP
ncbi:MAG TPA: hypothetical protein DCY85_03735 [Firmicutes bacterium]|nr:hypothetical protein [Bacillota bacterium]HBG43815.1 hypothetical protein [Bacillota bacterium]HBL69350.1 hypothetical protein [Bacillota bacterium]HCF90207.1 hypothetical protein [Bacillota bacterium]